MICERKTQFLVEKKGFHLGKRPRPPQQWSFVFGWNLKKFTRTVYVWVYSIIIGHFSIKIALLSISIFHGEDWSYQLDPPSHFQGQVKLLHEEAHFSEQESGSVHHGGTWPSAVFVLCYNWDLQAAQWTQMFGIYIFSEFQGRGHGSEGTVWKTEMCLVPWSLYILWLLSISFILFCPSVEILYCEMGGCGLYS